MDGVGPAALVEIFSGILIGVQLIILTGVILMVWNDTRRIGKLEQAMADLHRDLDTKRASIEGTIKDSVAECTKEMREVVTELKRNGHS